MSGQIVPAKEKYTAIKNFLEGDDAVTAIQRALPRHIDPGTMLRVALTAITKSPKLMDCEPPTIAQAVLEASQLGLMPDGVLGHGYMVPYGKKCTFIPGYKGLIDLARRSGKVDAIYAKAVYENDEFDYAFGLEPKLIHVPAQMLGKEPGELVAAYAVARLKDAEPVFDVMHKPDIEKIRKRSKTPDQGPWVTDYDEMSKKTVLRRLCKYLPLSTELTAAVAKDEYAERGLLDQLNLETEPIEPVSAPGAIDGLVSEVEEEPPIDVDPETGEVLGDPEQPEPQFEGTGRISSDEDKGFVTAIGDLGLRAAMVDKVEVFDRTLAREMGVLGAEKLVEIRARADRESLYLTLAEYVEAWEKSGGN
jgi:recombination protein RecT